MKRQWGFWVLATALFLGILLCVPLIADFGAGPAVTEAAPPNAPSLTVTCRTFNSSDVPKAIPDNISTYTRSTLPVSLAGKITAITTTLTISHTYPQDLEGLLCGPNTADCQLFTHGLTSTSGTYTVSFGSLSSVALPAGPPYTGVYESENPLGALEGKNASGVWSLLMRDYWGGDSGSLQAWSMTICAAPSAPTATPTAPLITDTPTPATCGEMLTIRVHGTVVPYSTAVYYDDVSVSGSFSGPAASVRAVAKNGCVHFHAGGSAAVEASAGNVLTPIVVGGAEQSGANATIVPTPDTNRLDDSTWSSIYGECVDGVAKPFWWEMSHSLGYQEYDITGSGSPFGGSPQFVFAADGGAATGTDCAGHDTGFVASVSGKFWGCTYTACPTPTPVRICPTPQPSFGWWWSW